MPKVFRNMEATLNEKDSLLEDQLLSFKSGFCLKETQDKLKTVFLFLCVYPFFLILLTQGFVTLIFFTIYSSHFIQRFG